MCPRGVDGGHRTAIAKVIFPSKRDIPHQMAGELEAPLSVNLLVRRHLLAPDCPHCGAIPAPKTEN
ncbi:hypothetical protein D082_08230 [Synechocystis sp. PCC 6714]|nr:hypothetical protein D082_08230 [Synechocystis sp. PCC 6714]